MVQALPTSAGGVGLIPSWGTNIPHASWPKNQNLKQKQYCNKLKPSEPPGNPPINSIKTFKKVRDGTGRKEGAGFRMGNTSIPVVDSC